MVNYPSKKQKNLRFYLQEDFTGLTQRSDQVFPGAEMRDARFQGTLEMQV